MERARELKTAPKGLKWKNKVLSGVPTKAGTTTYKTKDGEPVKVAILALPVGAKGTFNGVLQDGAGKQYPLKVSATAAGKLTATVTKGTKSYSLSAAKWSKVTLEPVGGVPHRMFAATLTASGLSLSVKVDADAAWNADALTARVRIIMQATTTAVIFLMVSSIKILKLTQFCVNSLYSKCS